MRSCIVHRRGRGRGGYFMGENLMRYPTVLAASISECCWTACWENTTLVVTEKMLLSGILENPDIIFLIVLLSLGRCGA